MKIFYLISLLTLLPYWLFSQSDCSNPQHIALIYLKTDVGINDVIKDVFPKLTKRKKAIVQFNLVGKLTYFGVADFRDMLQEENFEIDKELLNDWKQHEELYGFDSYQSESLIGLIPKNESNLYLTFSQSIDNYLVANIVTLDPLKYGYSGPVLHLFFRFDENGKVQEWYHVSGHLN